MLPTSSGPSNRPNSSQTAWDTEDGWHAIINAWKHKIFASIFLGFAVSQTDHPTWERVERCRGGQFLVSPAVEIGSVPHLPPGDLARDLEPNMAASWL